MNVFTFACCVSLSPFLSLSLSLSCSLCLFLFLMHWISYFTLTESECHKDAKPQAVLAFPRAVRVSVCAPPTHPHVRGSMHTP